MALSETVRVQVRFPSAGKSLAGRLGKDPRLTPEFPPDGFQIDDISGMGSLIDGECPDRTFQSFIAAAAGGSAIAHGFIQFFHNETVSPAVQIFMEREFCCFGLSQRTVFQFAGIKIEADRSFGTNKVYFSWVISASWVMPVRRTM